MLPRRTTLQSQKPAGLRALVAVRADSRNPKAHFNPGHLDNHRFSIPDRKKPASPSFAGKQYNPPCRDVSNISITLGNFPFWSGPPRQHVRRGGKEFERGIGSGGRRESRPHSFAGNRHVSTKHGAASSIGIELPGSPHAAVTLTGSSLSHPRRWKPFPPRCS